MTKQTNTTPRKPLKGRKPAARKGRPAAPFGVDPIFAAIKAERQADAACVAVDGNIPDDLADRRDDAWRLVLRTRATTPAGLAALTTWTREQAAALDESGSMLCSDDFLTIATTLDDSARGVSGLAPWSPPVAVERAPAQSDALSEKRLHAFMALEPGIRDIDRQCDILLILIEEKAGPLLIEHAAHQASEMAMELVKVWYEPDGGVSS